MSELMEECYTLADILNGSENERIELIFGIPVLMAPPAAVHQEIIAELIFQLKLFLDGKKCKVFPAPYAVRLFEEKNDCPENVHTLAEPDITVVCDPDKMDEIGCKGAPDFIIEVLSPSTRKRDLFTKYHLYLCAGVKEYWVVDPKEKSVRTFLLENGNYLPNGTGSPANTLEVSILKGCMIDLSKVFR